MLHRIVFGLIASFFLQAAQAADWVYSVVEGDNLWNLSEKYLDSPLRYEQLRKLNNVEYPKRMRPGTRIRVPMKWIRSNPVPATIADIVGNARLIRQDGSLVTDVAVDTRIFLGDTLKTGLRSSVAIRFADDSVITLHQSSEMRFDHLSAHGETGMVDSRLNLLDGRLDTRVTPATGPGSRFEIQTPSAISAVRGTEYRAAVKDDGKASNIEVLGGSVNVAGANKGRLIPAGFATRVVVDQQPKAPIPLLTAPSVEYIPSPVRQANWSLRWQPVTGANGYRVEISESSKPDVVAWEKLVDRTRLPLPDLPDGTYQVRIRGIDGEGIEGRSITRSLAMDTHPRPPVPLHPAESQTLRGESAELHWTASADAETYLLEIAADAKFARLLLRETGLRSTRFVVDAITQPGTYYWRVSSIADDGETGPAGVTRSWNLKPIPESLDAMVTGDQEHLIASWAQSDPQQRYQVQLAYDPKFSDIEIDRTSEQPSLKFSQLSGQVRYLRVRIVEPDGYLGPWGTVQRIDPPKDDTAWIVPLLGILGVLAL